MSMEFKIRTKEKKELVDITDNINKILKDSKVKNGLLLVYVPHSTASIIINENWDPNICKDFIDLLNDLVPEGKWRHDKVDANGAAHLKASILGPSETIIIKNNELVLGKWQSVMLVEFDGARERTVKVKIIEDKI